MLTAPTLSSPVVLVHGVSGLTRFFCSKAQPESFPGIRSYLEAGGNRVLVPRVSATASIATRAAELRAFVQRELGGQPFHLIGHSMGGLDSRYLISRLGLQDQAKSLTTVGTPHRAPRSPIGASVGCRGYSARSSVRSGCRMTASST